MMAGTPGSHLKPGGLLLAIDKKKIGKYWSILGKCCCLVDSFVTPWTVAWQTPLSMEFSRQEDWSGLPISSPGQLPDSGIKPASLALAGKVFTTEPSGEP